MPAEETTNAVPNTRIVTIGRQARAELSSLRFPFKRLVSVRGGITRPPRRLLHLSRMTSLVKVATQLECDARKPPAPFDASRDRFVDIAATWFGLNVAVALLLATPTRAAASTSARNGFANTRSLRGCTRESSRALLHARIGRHVALTGLGILNDASWACALAAQALPGIAGMQLRELLFFKIGLDDDRPPQPHGLLAAIIWAGCREHPEDVVRCLTAAGAAAAMEGGSVGCVIWTVSGGGRVASVLYAIPMTGCHLLILPLYVTLRASLGGGRLRRRPFALSPGGPGDRRHGAPRVDADDVHAWGTEAGAASGRVCGGSSRPKSDP